jgi:ribosomal protein S18 acetylase RimI-like enzyme
MPSYTHRPYAGSADRDATIDLWLAARSVAQGDPWPSLDLLQAELDACPHGTCAVQLWEDESGHAVATAMLFDESVLLTCTKVGADNECIEIEMLDWGLTSAVRAAHNAGERPGLYVPALSNDQRMIALLERSGFREGAFHLLRMERSLHEPIDPPCGPDGFIIRRFAPACDHTAVAALHATLFVDGRKGMYEQMALREAPGYRASLDLVTQTTDGTLAGYALGMACDLENRHLARSCGWVEFIGVAAAFRRHGLGHTLTIRLLHAMNTEQFAIARLTADTDNQAARHLFEQCGFHTRHTIRWYIWEPEDTW